MHKGILTAAAALLLQGAALTLSAPAHAQSGSMTWRGDVDNVTRIVIRDRSADAITTIGKGPSNVRSRFSGGSLNGATNVTLRNTHGRGQIRIVQQPNARNRYTAAIEIRDPDAGASNYEFQLNWDGGRGPDRPGPDRPGRPGRPDRPDRPGRPGRPGNGGSNNDAYRLGFDSGKEDRSRGLNNNYPRHRSKYNNVTERDFARGYTEGYNKR